MNLYRWYLLILSVSPFILLTIIYSDFWSVVGFLYKINRKQKRLYAKYMAWKTTRRVFRELKKNIPRHDRVSQEAFYWIKRWRWNEMYDRRLTKYLELAEKHKHPLEIEYEDRQQDFL